jgi:hypothetical protein
VSERKDPAMDGDQVAAVEAIVDQPLADVEAGELMARDDSVLGFGELPDRLCRLVETEPPDRTRRNPIKFARRYMANLMEFGGGTVHSASVVPTGARGVRGN